MKLTKEERDILASVERGEWQRVPAYQKEVCRYKTTSRKKRKSEKEGGSGRNGLRIAR